MDPHPNGDADGTPRPALVSAGSLSSGEPSRTKRRPVVLALGCVALLAGGLAVHEVGGERQPAGSQASRSAARSTALWADAAPSNHGGPAYVLHSEGATGRIRIVDVQRVRTETYESALGLILRLEVWAGVQDVTTDSFVVSDPDGTQTRASGVTVLVPGSTVVPSPSGFRIAAPAAIDLEVIVPVPSGVHVLSVVSDTQQKLAGFDVTG